MRQTQRLGVVMTMTLAVLNLPAFAHGDSHEQIAEITRQILETSGSAELYLRRAELFRLDEDWPAASADYARVEQLAPDAVAPHLGRGKMSLAMGRLDDAKAELDKVLTTNPDHIDGLVTRARVETKQGKPLAAADDFARVLSIAPRAGPEYYLERAQALATAGEDRLTDALHCLDEGTAKLGNLPTLGLYAIDLELRQKHFAAALARLDKLSAPSPRKEAWLERRGDILSTAGRPDEARQAYLAGCQAIEGLPAHRRQTKATSELGERLTAKAAR